MPCLIGCIALAAPRAFMFFIWLLTDWFTQAFGVAWLLPVLGFVFLPYTTLAYMAAMLNNAHQLSGLWLVLVILAAVVDVGHWGGGGRTAYVRYRHPG